MHITRDLGDKRQTGRWADAKLLVRPLLLQMLRCGSNSPAARTVPTSPSPYADDDAKRKCLGRALRTEELHMEQLEGHSSAELRFSGRLSDSSAAAQSMQARAVAAAAAAAAAQQEQQRAPQIQRFEQQQEECAFPQGFVLRFAHRCRMQACSSSSCQLCRNNTHKRCEDEATFEPNAAQCQVLRARCGGDITLELTCAASGERITDMPNIGVQMCVVDGRSCRQSMPATGARELLRADDGKWLLEENSEVGHARCVRNAAGHLQFQLQDGAATLPAVQVTEKTDSFRMGGQSFSNFRLMARAVQLDQVHSAGQGPAVVLQDIAPAVSNKFLVKSLRAVDISQQSYLHYKDSVKRLKYMNANAAECLWNIQEHIPDCPFTSIQTVEHLTQLIWYTDHNLEMQAKLLEVLNMHGAHKHKWEHIRSFLSQRVVQDDDAHRAWFADGAMTRGLLFTCKQGEIDMDAPLGVLERHVSGQLQVFSLTGSHSMEAVGAWMLEQAREAWHTPAHQGWVVVNEPLDLADPSTSEEQQQQQQHHHQQQQPQQQQQQQQQQLQQQRPQRYQRQAVSSALLTTPRGSSEFQDPSRSRSRSFTGGLQQLRVDEWGSGSEGSPWITSSAHSQVQRHEAGLQPLNMSMQNMAVLGRGVPGALLPASSSPKAKRQRVSAQGDLLLLGSTPASSSLSPGTSRHVLSSSRASGLPPKPRTGQPSPRAVSCTGQAPSPRQQQQVGEELELTDRDFAELLAMRSSGMPRWADRLSAPAAPSPAPSPAARWRADLGTPLADCLPDPFSSRAFELLDSVAPTPFVSSQLHFQQLAGTRSTGTLPTFQYPPLEPLAAGACGRSMSTGHMDVGISMHGGGLAARSQRGAAAAPPCVTPAPVAFMPAAAPVAAARPPQHLWPQGDEDDIIML